MDIEERQEQVSVDPRRNHYTVQIRRDTEMMMIFIRFQNRVSHPRVTFNLFATGVLLAAVPVIVKGLALPGVIVSYGVGGLLILTALFRQYLTLSMMKSNPDVKENEEITYYFGNTGVRAVHDDGTEENMGHYKNIYRLWEDEKIFYIGMNEDDLLILPKENITGDVPEEFKEFILEKSGAEYRWKPTGIVNKWKDFLAKTRNRVTYLRMEAEDKEKQKRK